MKKILLSIIYIITCTFFANAQTLFGTTVYGGSGGGGTINQFLPATNDLTVVKSFESLAASVPWYTKFIQASDGKLYGMTSDGGRDEVGVIFSYDPATSTYIKLKDFVYTDGAFPYGSLIQASNGKLYGMTAGGGIYGDGVIFSFDPSNSTYTKLMDFGNANGSLPYGSLVQASNGKLYGMTSSGGTNGAGVIFSFDPSISTFTKLKDFDETNGGYAYGGSLIQAGDGKLYGMTTFGGSGGYGVIFSLNPLTSAYTKLKDLDYTNGAYSYGSLMEASNGKLYGMTASGGTYDGVIFSFTPSTSTYTKVKDFDYTNGGAPYGSLIQASNGKLYGMTTAGGGSDVGVIFSFDPSNSGYIILSDFDDTNGAYPYGSLMQAINGKLYGLTSYGGAGSRGVIFPSIL